MEKPVLTAPKATPTMAMLRNHLGKAAGAYEAFCAHNQAEHPEIAVAWNYYRDGNSWLMKGLHKKRTVFWLAVFDGYFCVTFYVGSKADVTIMKSGIPDEDKQRFLASAGKKIRGVTLHIKTLKDLLGYKEMLAIKLAASASDSNQAGDKQLAGRKADKGVVL